MSRFRMSGNTVTRLLKVSAISGCAFGFVMVCILGMTACGENIARDYTVTSTKPDTAPYKVDAPINSAVDMLNETGNGTVSIRGDVPSKGWAVFCNASYKREVDNPDDVQSVKDALYEEIKKASDFLEGEDGMYIGAVKDTYNGKITVGLQQVVDTKEEALNIADKYGAWYIYDLSGKKLVEAHPAPEPTKDAATDAPDPDPNSKGSDSVDSDPSSPADIPSPAQ